MINYIRRQGLMRPGDRVGVAVSGGADSVALLRLLLEARGELGIVLSVVHFNHKIRGAEADQDEKFVRGLARGLQLEFYCERFDTPAHARFRNMSLEAAARDLRYAFFRRLLTSRARTVASSQSSESESGSAAPGSAMVGLDRVATAHTRDDQAETVLLRLMRGAGTRGLAGIYPKFLVSSPQFLEKTGPAASSPSGSPEATSGGGPAVVRPLLEITRAELRTYLEQQGQPWREDVTNRDVSYARNRLRHELIPLLTREYNPALAEVLSDMAEIARGEEEYWDCEVRQRMPKVAGRAVGERPATIFVERLLAETAAMQRRLLRAFAEQHGLRLEFRHVEELLAIARAEASAAEIRAELPQGWEAVRQEGELWFRIRSEQAEQKAAYDFALPAGRQVEVAGRKIRAILVSGQVSSAGEAGGSASVTRVLLDAALMERNLRVRNWRPGDRYWPAHTKEPKKLKELLQARHIPRAYKAIWPVVVSGMAAGSPAPGSPPRPGFGRGGVAVRPDLGRDGVQEEIVWVPGFAAPERFQVQPESTEALLLEEAPLDSAS